MPPFLPVNRYTKGYIMTPLQRYEADLKREDFKPDAAQRKAVEHLDLLYHQLVDQNAKKPALTRFFNRKAKQPIKGLYFWGGVGRGKTYLVDTFYNCLPFEEKIRNHYHRFMLRIHNELTSFAGQADPLKLIAKKIAQEAKVICLDEFFVKDITDAMLLANLLEALFSEGVVLVTTSNIVPDNLYENGLQRARFLPAIALLKQYTQVVNVDSGIDYRLRTLTEATLYTHPIDEAAEASLIENFIKLSGNKGELNQQIEVNKRQLQVKRLGKDIAWFEFDELCDGPRSQNDYIELAKLYSTVFISNLPQLGAAKEDQTRRFINLVDEFYDCSVKLFINAEKPIEEIYSGGSLAFEIERTQSRLLEMQSEEYLALEHSP